MLACLQWTRDGCFLLILPASSSQKMVVRALCLRGVDLLDWGLRASQRSDKDLIFMEAKLCNASFSWGFCLLCFWLSLVSHDFSFSPQVSPNRAVWDASGSSSVPSQETLRIENSTCCWGTFRKPYEFIEPHRLIVSPSKHYCWWCQRGVWRRGCWWLSILSSIWPLRSGPYVRLFCRMRLRSQKLVGERMKLSCSAHSLCEMWQWSLLRHSSLHSLLGKKQFILWLGLLRKP